MQPDYYTVTVRQTINTTLTFAQESFSAYLGLRPRLIRVRPSAFRTDPMMEAIWNGRNTENLQFLTP